MMLHVICVAYNRPNELVGLICSFLAQTDGRWALNIIYDGPVPAEVKRLVSQFNDPRIHFSNTHECHGEWGHPNRALMLDKIAGACDDYVLMTNDDNYYVPKFVELFLKQCRLDVGMVYCNTVHSYMDYDILFSRVKENMIDMGSFIVRQNVAKAVGFKHRHLSADGRYAEECAAYCLANQLAVKYLDKPLFIHN
jgi:hypothetical protein